MNPAFGMVKHSRQPWCKEQYFAAVQKRAAKQSVTSVQDVTFEAGEFSLPIVILCTKKQLHHAPRQEENGEAQQARPMAVEAGGLPDRHLTM